MAVKRGDSDELQLSSARRTRARSSPCSCSWRSPSPASVAFLSWAGRKTPLSIKQMTVVTAWPGATAKEMEELVAERLEKRMQEPLV